MPGTEVKPAVAAAGQKWTPQFAPSAPGVVVVVGDASAAEVVAALRQANVPVSGDRASLRSAGLVVIAQDARDGIMRVHRDLIKELASAGKRDMLWIITKTPVVDDGDLLALEELEARELLTQHQLPGEAVRFGVDSESVTLRSDSTMLKGWPAIARYVEERR